MTDWKDQARADRLRFDMVSPTNIDAVYGELTGVVLHDSSITCGYYTDTRTAGTLTVRGDGWRRGSLVRVTHTAPGWRNVIGTYIVGNDDGERGHGGWGQTLELRSILHGLSTDRLTGPFTVARGGYALAAIKKLLASRGRRAVYSRPTDHRYGSAKVYPTGEAVLSVLFDLCAASGNRLDVDGRGRVTVGRYVRPASKTPKLTVDLADPRGTVDGGVSLHTNYLEMPTNAVVSYRDGYGDDAREIRATATVAKGSHASRGARGYTVTEYRELTEMSPKTWGEAQKRADRLLRDGSRELVEWTLTTRYLPLWEGDMVTLSVPDGRYKGKRKCLVKSADIDLGTMAMKVVLKETASGDEED